MQGTISHQDMDFNFPENLKRVQENREVWFPFREHKPAPQEALRRIQALQKKYSPKGIEKGIDLSELINELNYRGIS